MRIAVKVPADARGNAYSLFVQLLAVPIWGSPFDNAANIPHSVELF